MENYNTSTQHSNQKVIAQSSNSDCGGLTSTSNFQEGLNIINKSLKEHGLPIMVGVHHPKYNTFTDSYYDACSGNSPNITNHYIIIVGSGFDRSLKKKYYLFYEVGTSNKTNGISLENRLYLENDNLLVGNTKYKNYEGYYTVTEVRKNNGQTY